jgi:Subtilase family
MNKMQATATGRRRAALLASLSGILVLIVPLAPALAQFDSRRGPDRAYQQNRVVPRQAPLIQQDQRGRGQILGGQTEPGYRRATTPPRVGEPPVANYPPRTRVPRGEEPRPQTRPPRGDGPWGGPWGNGRPPPGNRPPGRPVFDPEVSVYDPWVRPRYPRQPVYEQPDDFDDEPVVRRPRPRPVIVRPEPPPPRVQRATPSGGGTRPPATNVARPAAPRFPPVSIPVVAERRLVADEVLVELTGNATAVQGVATRHRLTLISSERFTLANATLSRFRVNGGRSARTVLAEMTGNPAILTAQPNYVYTLQQAVPTEAEKLAEAVRLADPLLASVPSVPAEIRPPDLPEAPVAATALPLTEKKPQYVPARIGLDAAHRVARGERVRIAVIDSGADRKHPELEGTITRSFDAVGGTDPLPHQHGTAMTAAIMARASLQGIAPAAELLSARAFSGGATGTGAEGTTVHILKSLDWAAAEGARVVNLSFAGPQDRLLSRALESAKTRGMVVIAAAGNGGPQAAAMYPGADPNVIAVTATDADDKAFPQANRGGYIALAAPGVDVLAAAPEAGYAFSSGTSIAAAHVSGLVALMMERRPDLDLAAVRAILSETAIDLGAKGKDPVFGAGRINAPAALARTVLPTTAQR